MITPVIRLRYRRPLTPRHAWSVDPREIFTASIAFNLRWPNSVDISDHGWAVASFGNVPRLIDRSREVDKDSRHQKNARNAESAGPDKKTRG
jgi:hypothetical protein